MTTLFANCIVPGIIRRGFAASCSELNPRGLFSKRMGKGLRSMLSANRGFLAGMITFLSLPCGAETRTGAEDLSRGEVSEI
jgi:hypothetical protein